MSLCGGRLSFGQRELLVRMPVQQHTQCCRGRHSVFIVTGMSVRKSRGLQRHGNFTLRQIHNFREQRKLMQEDNSFTALYTPNGRRTHHSRCDMVDILLEPFPWVWLSGQSAAATGCDLIVGQSQRLHSQDLGRLGRRDTFCCFAAAPLIALGCSCKQHDCMFSERDAMLSYRTV